MADSRVELTRIVSGGQTGVDRGALEAALERKFPCDGWCPEGRKAEDGCIPSRFPVTELAGGGYADRTRRNVRDSDGTAVIYFGAISGGTLLTLRCCDEDGRSRIAIDATTVTVSEAATTILDFVRRYGVATLNVAGPRESGAPGAERRARQIVGELLDRVSSARSA